MKFKSWSAFIFLALNILAGALNYLFQAMSAKFLTTENFGLFSAWFSWLSLGLATGVFTQYLANFFNPSQNMVRGLSVVVGAISILIFSLLISYPSLPAWGIAGLTLMIAPLTHWLMGVSQRRLMTSLFSVACCLVAAIKILTLLVWQHNNILENIFWSLPLSYAAGAILLSPCLLMRDPVKEKSPDFLLRSKDRIAGAVLLSVLIVAIPNVDLIFIDLTQDKTVLAMYAQVGLIYKVIFFLFMILAQWMLPHQLKGAQGGLPPQNMKYFVRICVQGLVFSLAATVMTPFLFDRVLNKPLLAPQLWIFLACFYISLLTGFFIEIQRQVTAFRTKDATAATIIYFSVYGILCLLAVDVVTYLQVQIATAAILFYLLILGAGRILSAHDS